MLKDKLLKYSINLSIAALIVIVCAGAGYCSGEVAEQAVPQSSGLHSAIIKFLKAMGGVAISSIIIYLGLTIYNKFFVHPRLDGNLEEDVLRTPRSKDEALTFFIKKNKIK